MHFYVVKLSILGLYLSDFGSTFYSDRGVYFAKMCQKCISYVLGSILEVFHENRKLIPKGPLQCVTGLQSCEVTELITLSDLVTMTVG